MKVLQSKDHLTSIKSGVILGESFDLGEKIEQLAAWTVLKNKVEFFIGLKRVVKLDQERMIVVLGQDVSFYLHVHFLFFVGDFFFL